MWYVLGPDTGSSKQAVQLSRTRQGQDISSLVVETSRRGTAEQAKSDERDTAKENTISRCSGTTFSNVRLAEEQYRQAPSDLLQHIGAWMSVEYKFQEPYVTTIHELAKVSAPPRYGDSGPEGRTKPYKASWDNSVPFAPYNPPDAPMRMSSGRSCGVSTSGRQAKLRSDSLRKTNGTWT
jgi:hypothetical protein